MMIREGLTFDDVLLVPKYSTVKSRGDIDTSAKLGKLSFSHPVIPANMKTVTGMRMAVAVAESGGLSILHRFWPVEEQLKIAEDMIEEHGARDKFAVSVGVKEEDYLNIQKFMDVGVKMFCVDIAHGDSEGAVRMVTQLRKAGAFIIAGNVATGTGARSLWENGADVVKVGVGPGSLCTTRIETGNGVPQLTALMDVFNARQHNSEYIISDGGIKNAGDVVKALCFSDMVMVGNLFAGCEETPGAIMYIDGKPFKEYVGSSTHRTNHIEGVAAIVPVKTSYKNILSKLLEGLVSGCSYQGVHNVHDLRNNPEFIRITNSGLRESHPHDVILK